MKRYKDTLASRIVLFTVAIATSIGCVAGVSYIMQTSSDSGIINTYVDNNVNVFENTEYGNFGNDEIKLEDENVVITEDQSIDTSAMLTKTCTIEFMPDTVKFKNAESANKTLMEFIEIAKILDDAVIQIEGNIHFNGPKYKGDDLSIGRAEAVKKFFIENGIDANRIITVGNGNSKMIYCANSQRNRRVDIFFKTN